MIGVFDSGLGGLTVVKEIFTQLPGYGIVYFGDTARMPYGTKGEAAIKRFSVSNAKFLESVGAEVIVVACNTASAVAIKEIRQAVKIPVFEVVTPAVRQVLAKKGEKIGIIGTPATVRSAIYKRLIHQEDPKMVVFQQDCPLFVPLVEEGSLNRPEVKLIARRYLNKLKLRHIDTLVLGCTHYPFLRRQIGEAIGSDVRHIDPARATVAELKNYLERHPQAVKREGERARYRFIVSDVSEHFVKTASRWLRRPIKLELAKIK